uniref:Uncharacterized protein n=1 Tax=Setaria viridis TaxID=4556 RepID=A0A4U6TJW5_SETVI|nr:hypothetical protein SEVIR_8G262100v2 [Setaria viridis]
MVLGGPRIRHPFPLSSINCPLMSCSILVHVFGVFFHSFGSFLRVLLLSIQSDQFLPHPHCPTLSRGKHLLTLSSLTFILVL